MLLEIDNQDRNTLLAALRAYQEAGYGDPAKRPDYLHEIATDGDCEISADDVGIDELCERINCALPLAGKGARVDALRTSL